ncbi:hypothetical protein [Terribacillus sp. DMT04]|uniref:hypothetical protein n=1 Tax=Terribacillus sp. DMT04 TaxID=2850441 RepID=UPI001C2C601F|nr:hypothetical protein [Terribacillus sp. DMT04]QXE00561.1 hypothetical protein KS242_11060 [Terribacillus sp. DMT04]
MLDINLLRNQSQEHRSPVLFLSILGAVVLVCAAIFAWQLLAAKGQLQDLEAQQAANQAELDARTTSASGSASMAMPYPVELMDRLHGLIPKGSELITYAGHGLEPITVTLLVENEEAAADYIQAARETGFVSRSSLQSITPQGANSFQAVFIFTIDQAAWTSEVTAE